MREGDAADVTVHLHTANHLLRLNTQEKYCNARKYTEYCTRVLTEVHTISSLVFYFCFDFMILVFSVFYYFNRQNPFRDPEAEKHDSRKEILDRRCDITEKKKLPV